MVVLAVLIVLLVAAIITVLALLGARDHHTTHTSTPMEVSPAPSASAPSTSTTPAPAPAPTSRGDSPAGVTQSFFDAILKGDCATAQRYVTGADLSGGGACDPSAFPTELLSQVKVSVGQAAIDGDSATVPVHLVPDVRGVDAGSLGLPTVSVRLSRVGGEWKLTGVS